MHTTSQSWKLGGFVDRAIDSLAAQNQVGVWGRSTPEFVKAVADARLRICELAYAFRQAGMAEELANRASDERSHPFAGLLLRLALRAWPFARATVPFRGYAPAEGRAEWHSLHEHLRDCFLGASRARGAVRDA